MAIIKRQITTNTGEDVEKSESSYIACENVNGTAALENSLAFPQKVKHRVITCDGSLYESARLVYGAQLFGQAVVEMSPGRCL